MRHPWIIPLIAAVAAGAAAYAITKHPAGERTGTTLSRLDNLSFLTRELNLTDKQAEDIRRLHTQLGDRLSDCCRRHCAARTRLGRAVVAESNDTGKAEAVLAEMCRTYEQSERATLAHIRAVRAILNEEQRGRFDKMITGCMCREDRKGAGSEENSGNCGCGGGGDGCGNGGRGEHAAGQ
jgi:hypothetical protein